MQERPAEDTWRTGMRKAPEFRGLPRARSRCGGQGMANRTPPLTAWGGVVGVKVPLLASRPR